jgi:hypothetical protein
MRPRSGWSSSPSRWGAEPVPGTGRRKERKRPEISPSASPEAVRAREILADGEWHEYEELMRELVPLVAPGRAWRANEEGRYRQALHRARAKGEELPWKPPRVRPVDPDRARESGARAIVRKMLNSGYFEIDPPGRAAKKRIRDPGTNPSAGSGFRVPAAAGSPRIASIRGTETT